MSRHRFLVAHENLLDAEVVVEGDELRHLRARRLAVGEAVVVGDGAGSEREAVVAEIERGRALLRFTGELRAIPAPRLRLTLAQALLKADKLDWVVEKATELGADSIVLLRSERVVGGLSAARLARLQRLARSAAKQAQRARVPEVGGPFELESFLRDGRERERVLFWEEAATPLRSIMAEILPLVELVVVIGPEGGFSRAEVDAARAAGCRIAGLGSHILRAETAAVAALALCQYAAVGDIS